MVSTRRRRRDKVHEGLSSLRLPSIHRFLYVKKKRRKEEASFTRRRPRDKVCKGIVPPWCAFASSFPLSEEKKKKPIFTRRRRRDKVHEGIVPPSCAFASSFPLCEEKKKKPIFTRRRQRDKSSWWMGWDGIRTYR